MNKKYLQENNLYEAHKQFMRLCEWSFVSKPLEEEKQEIVEQETIVVEPIIEVEEIVKNNEEIKEDNVMDTKEKIQMANAILNAEQPKVKKVKKEKGLIERTESSITILTEDNRELLKD